MKDFLVCLASSILTLFVIGFSLLGIVSLFAGIEAPTFDESAQQWSDEEFDEYLASLEYWDED